MLRDGLDGLQEIGRLALAPGRDGAVFELSAASGTTRRSSKNSSTPSPSQAGQAPKGALKENSRGSISGMVKPETGQAKFSEKVMRSGSPSPSLRGGFQHRDPVGEVERGAETESASRVSSPSRTTIRSTTTSMSWRNFLSSVGGSSRSWNRRRP
jgi:hypothetical protein